MNKRDKDKLLILLMLLLYCVITVGMIYGTKRIPWQAIICVLLVCEYFIVQPKICKLYYQAVNSKASIGRFIPFWNEIMIFKSSDALATLISYVMLAISLSIFFIPAAQIGSIFGEHIMFNYGIYVIRIIAVALIVNSIIVGISFLHVNSRIRQMHIEFTSGGKIYTTSVLSNVLLFVPIIRVISLIGIMNTLIKLVSLNNYVINNQETNNLVEEN